MVVASEFSLEFPDPDTHTTMRFQRERDRMIAAAQLPSKQLTGFSKDNKNVDRGNLLGQWEAVTLLVVSGNMSPAARRLALHLMFAVYIMGPHLGRYDPWADSRYAPVSTQEKIFSDMMPVFLPGSW